MGDTGTSGSSGTSDTTDAVRWPLPGETGVEVLRPRFTFGAALLFLIPWAFPLGIIAFCSMPVGGYLGEAILGEGPAILVGVLTGVVVGSGLVWLVLSLRRRVYTRTQVVVSSVGVHVRDHRGTEVRLRWEDVTSVAVLTGVAAPTLAGRVVDAAVQTLGGLGAQVHPSAGLIGWGTRVLAPKLPRREAELLSQQRYDVGTGRYEVAVPFKVAGPVDISNRMVAYTRHYRPDLLAPSGPN